MKVDIWSDVRCPFCYIGKHAFEKALAEFPRREDVEVVWHSFELDPHLKTQPELSMYDYIGQLKGLSPEDVREMHERVSEMGASQGIFFEFERAVVANSLDAHRLIQFAKSKGMAGKAEEALFEAYFSGGVNIDDPEALVRIGTGIGLPEEELRPALVSDALTAEVRADERQAASLGIRGVPFFVFNGKYGVSGAQPSEVFFKTLDTVWKEFEKENTLTVIEGDTCTPDGICAKN